MNKQEFIELFRSKLSGLPEENVEDRVSFYSEMIDDWVEAGFSEEEAVSELGSVDEIVEQIIADIPFRKIAKEKIKPQRRLRGWEIALLVIGSPLWLALLLSVFAVIFSLYVIMWSLIVSLWATFASLAVCGACGIGVGIAFAVTGKALSGIALIGACLICLGLAIFLFFASKSATKGMATLTKKIAIGIKKLFVKKEGV